MTRSIRSRATGGALCVIAGAGLLLAGWAGTSGAAAVAPTVITAETHPPAGNPDCGDLGYDFGIKIDAQVEDGTYDDADLVKEPGTTGTYAIEISGAGVVEGVYLFDFESLLPEGAPQAFDAVFVKQANGGHLYEYPSPVTADTDLASTGGAISHVSFCWDEPETTTDDGTTDDGTTDDGTTDDGTTDDGTTDDGTTDDGTTDDGTTDDGTTDEVLATDGEADDGTTDEEVLETVVTQPATEVKGSQTLPATGSDGTGLLALAGLGLVVTGLVLVASGRERAIA